MAALVSGLYDIIPAEISPLPKYHLPLGSTLPPNVQVFFQYRAGILSTHIFFLPPPPRIQGTQIGLTRIVKYDQSLDLIELLTTGREISGDLRGRRFKG